MKDIVSAIPTITVGTEAGSNNTYDRTGKRYGP